MLMQPVNTWVVWGFRKNICHELLPGLNNQPMTWWVVNPVVAVSFQKFLFHPKERKCVHVSCVLGHHVGYV